MLGATNASTPDAPCRPASAQTHYDVSPELAQYSLELESSLASAGPRGSAPAATPAATPATTPAAPAAPAPAPLSRRDASKLLQKHNEARSKP